MRISISSWFVEQNVGFKIYYKVYSYMMDQITQQLVKNKNINNDDFINICVTTKKDLKKHYFSKSNYDKKNEIITYVFWLPYYPIVDSKNELEIFLKYFFLVLKELFEKYGVQDGEIELIQKKVEIEVLNNKKYEYKKLNDTYDLSEFINKMGIK